MSRQADVQRCRTILLIRLALRRFAPKNHLLLIQKAPVANKWYWFSFNTSMLLISEDWFDIYLKNASHQLGLRKRRQHASGVDDAAAIYQDTCLIGEIVSP